MMFSRIATFARVLGTTISSRTRSVLLDIGGIGGMGEDDTDDDNGEVAPQNDSYGMLGILARPLPPEVIKGKNFACEVVCLRTADGLVPVGWRDLRLDDLFPNGIPEGRFALAHYGGGFHSLDLTATKNGDQKSTIQTIYCPFDFANGVARKAATVVVDTTPGAEHITLSIGGGTSGFQLSMTEADGLQVRTPDASTLFNIREDEITLAAKKVTIKGNVYLGSQAEAGVPLLAGPASPPSPSVFVSPV